MIDKWLGPSSGTSLKAAEWYHDHCNHSQAESTFRHGEETARASAEYRGFPRPSHRFMARQFAMPHPRVASLSINHLGTSACVIHAGAHVSGRGHPADEGTELEADWVLGRRKMVGQVTLGAEKLRFLKPDSDERQRVKSRRQSQCAPQSKLHSADLLDDANTSKAD